MEPLRTGTVTTRKVNRPFRLVVPDAEQDLTLNLKQLKLYQAEDRRWAIAEVEVGFSLYDTLQHNHWLGLTTASIAAEQPLTWTFRSDLPIELTLKLADDVLDSMAAEHSAEGILERLEQAIEAEEPATPRLLASWRYLSVVQANRTVGGAVVKEGFRSRYQP